MSIKKQHTKQTEIPVVLRIQEANGELLAFFPTEPAGLGGYSCSTYAHIGQHNGANYWGCVRASRPATAAESASLLQELERIGYRLRVIEQVTQARY